MPTEYATFLAGLDRRIREEGTEDQTTDTVKNVTGRDPISLEQLITMHVQV